MKPHPFTADIPEASEETIAELVSSMKACAFIMSMPIIVLDGGILDGRARLDAANRAGVIPVFRQYSDYQDGDPYKFLQAVNAGRRDLSAEQSRELQAKLAAKRAAWIEARKAELDAAGRKQMSAARIGVSRAAPRSSDGAFAKVFLPSSATLGGKTPSTQAPPTTRTRGYSHEMIARAEADNITPARAKYMQNQECAASLLREPACVEWGPDLLEALGGNVGHPERILPALRRTARREALRVWWSDTGKHLPRARLRGALEGFLRDLTAAERRPDAPQFTTEPSAPTPAATTKELRATLELRVKTYKESIKGTPRDLHTAWVALQEAHRQYAEALAPAVEGEGHEAPQIH